ncbi:Aste57867_354 [Aphanomyces stellatus]|uniref:Bifunctional lysine-specific demethylase and histidyl-hydroxylase n=1 Tax=Aphanomyces stellatus TaxID=120398 RepID=A0A485K4W7_9STRA|nr:hypothetical protein As57867_000353 [Aphanomyces stellatus]VFT77580.1 Aste57867_354 [Aphanomyces stellatus]
MARTKKNNAAKAPEAMPPAKKHAAPPAPVKNTPPSKKQKKDGGGENVGSPLKALLKGTTVEAFDRDVFEKKPLLIKSITPCSGLFSRQALLDVLGRESLEYTTDLTVTVYKNGERHNFEPEENDDDDEAAAIATADQVDDLLSSGYSVQFYQPQRYVDQLCAFNAALEAHYGCLAGSSAYLTPPNAQALAPHHDDVDVFILQTEGSKHWKLYAPLVELAGEHSNDLSPSVIGQPTMELTLEEGDMLYFPRGTIHQASTSDAFSTHVTISIYHHNSWANFMEVALPKVLRRAFEKDVAFRQGLPPNWLAFMGSQHPVASAKSKQFTQTFHRLTSELIKHVDESDLHGAADDSSLDFIQHRLPPTKAPFQKAFLKDALNLRLRHKAYCRIVLQDDTVTLFHAVTNCRHHHMGQCTCDDDDGDGDDDDDDDDDDDEEALPPQAKGMTFPLECAPVLLHLYATAPAFTSMEAMMAKQIADEDSIRGVVFRLIAEDMAEKQTGA